MNCNFFKKIILFFIYCLLGFGFTLSGTNLRLAPAVGINPPEQILIEEAHKIRLLEKEGEKAYRENDYSQALGLWQQALKKAQAKKQQITQAKLMGKIALAHQQLGNSDIALRKIQQAQKLLERTPNKQEKQKTLAQLLNNQGIIQFTKGENTEAIASWEQAALTYQKLEDTTGLIKVKLNQAKVHKILGLYQRANNNLEEIASLLGNQPDSKLKVIALRSYGATLRLLGNIQKSQEILEEALDTAQKISDSPGKIETILSLGKTLSVAGDVQQQDNNQDNVLYQQAFVHYEQGIESCQNLRGCEESNLFFALNLGKLDVASKMESWDETTKTLALVRNQLPESTQDSEQLALKISLANSLLELRQRARSNRAIQASMPNFQEIITLLNEAIANGQRMNDLPALSQAWGLKGNVLELSQKFKSAIEATTRALEISQKLNSKEKSYLWEWQLGRVEQARGNNISATQHYLSSIDLLEALSHDIANIDNSLQNSFREKVEPVYRETVSLLLNSNSDQKISQQNLIKARDILEALQIAELNNFFREACLEGSFVAIDDVDREAAAIYPIILSDRLEIILSLPQQPLKHYRIEVSQEELEATIAKFRQNIVIRSRRTFYDPAQKLYKWLIEPITQDLEANQIKTLVFIPDGALRSIPLSALHDGQQYLIEQFGLVLNPGLRLLDPRPLEENNLNIIAAGISKSRGKFAPLDYVTSELGAIEKQLDSEIIVDEEFTTEALRAKIAHSDSHIVHIATHGQFSSSLQDTFLLAWDNRIDLNQFSRILRSRGEDPNRPIKLLVLSACETAVGDNQAALGLAGMAIQSGARSTIATLWSINDRATAYFMSNLYQEISQKSRGKGKAEAIRQAQLKLLKDPNYEHPFYWAAYTTVGDWL